MKQKLLLFLFLFSSSLLSAESFSVGQITYEITSATTVEITGAQTSITSAVIPANVMYQLKSYTVTSIKDWAFSNCGILQLVDIPNTVTSIGMGTFATCFALSSVFIPNSVTLIGSDAFFQCSSLNSIVIPGSITSIMANTFFGCSALNSIVVPDSVVSIGQSAFWGCAFTSLNMGNSVKSIGSHAFAYCTSLSFVVIPNAVTSIDTGAFESCTSLTSVLIPNSVTSIGDEAFADCTSLISISCDIEIPLIIDPNVFSNVNKSACSLDVPATSVSAYKVADVWKDFMSTLGTDSFYDNQPAVFYPNPFSNTLYIGTSNTDDKRIQLLDLNGKILINQTVTAETDELDTTTLAAGMYFIKISSENDSMVKKVIKK